MRSHRFYTPDELIVGRSLELSKEASHHCLQVLRYQPGDCLTLFNGDGFDYLATVELVNSKRCQVSLTEKSDPLNESPLRVHLFQGIARGEKMDLIIQKAVELGVAEITPVFSERCNVKLDGNRLSKKIQHWQSIAISACEQSGRAFIPKVNDASHLKHCQQIINSIALCLEPTAVMRLADCQQNLSPNQMAIALFIGPEGGFAESDLLHLQSIGVLQAKLGPRILRTETAGLSAIAILQSHFGDL